MPTAPARMWSFRGSLTQRRRSSATRTGGGSSRAMCKRSCTRRSRRSDAHRCAAISGQLDLVLDPPPQDIDRPVATPSVEGGRRRREPHHLHRHGPGPRRASATASVKGKNPFKDVRVRKALYHAMDIESLITDRCAARRGPPARSRLRRWAYQRCRARAASALRSGARQCLDGGSRLPAGLRGDADCPNNRYINDESDLPRACRPCGRRSALR